MCRVVAIGWLVTIELDAVIRENVAINIRRVAGTNFADTIDKTVGTASDSDSVKSLAAQSPSEESAAVASPSASQQEAVKADATAVRTEDGIEVRRALPVGASQTPSEIILTCLYVSYTHRAHTKATGVRMTFEAKMEGSKVISFKSPAGAEHSMSSGNCQVSAR
jgi:hypothetical protein